MTFYRMVVASFLLLAAACTPNNEKTKQSFDIKSILEKIDDNEMELKDFNVFLLGDSPKKNFNSTKLNFKLYNPDQLTSIEGRLEEYVELTTRLLKVADNRVVVFYKYQIYSEKLARAESYLARVYAEVYAKSPTNPRVQTSWLDESELQVRMARFAEIIQRHERRGLSLGNLDKTGNAIDRYNLNQLKELSTDMDQVAFDCLRLSILIDRNNGWGLGPGMATASRGYSGLVTYAQQIKIVADEFIKRKK